MADRIAEAACPLDILVHVVGGASTPSGEFAVITEEQWLTELYRQVGVLVPVSRRAMFAIDAHRVRDTEDSGRLSYSRTRRRCSIRVP